MKKTTSQGTKKKGAAAKPLSSRQEMKAIVGGCEEASPSSRDFYIPCNNTAVRNIYHKADKRTYRMCKSCAAHNIKNRGAVDKGPYKLETTKKKVEKFESPEQVERKHKQNKIMESSEFEHEEASGDQLANITKEAMKAVALEKQIGDLNAAVALLVADRDTILNKSLPSLLDSANMEAFDLKDGSSIEIKDVVSGTLPSAATKPKERDKALAWLHKNGGKGLIKTTFKTEFGTGQEALVAAFEKLITKAKFTAKKDTGVHPQTLCAFVRELLEDGKKVPIETLGIYVGRHAKIKLSADAQKKAESERVKPGKRSK